MERRALYAGSFDPITNGHLDIIERAAGMYDSLTVLIAYNPAKKGFFSADERAAIVTEVTKHISNVRVDKFSGLLADYVNANDFTAYIRGIRTSADFENELQMAQMNARLFKKNTETVLMVTDPEYSFVSSSLMKEVAALGGCTDGLIPPFAAERIREKLNERNR